MSNGLRAAVPSFRPESHRICAGSVSGDVDSNLFGQVVKAAPPRLMQVALKFTF